MLANLKKEKKKQQNSSLFAGMPTVLYLFLKSNSLNGGEVNCVWLGTSVKTEDDQGQDDNNKLIMCNTTDLNSKSKLKFLGCAVDFTKIRTCRDYCPHKWNTAVGCCYLVQLMSSV